MEVHQRRKKKNGKALNQNVRGKESTADEKTSNYLKLLSILALLGLLAGLLYVIAVPPSYSGPRHQHTEKAAEKRAEEAAKSRKVEDEVPFEAENFSSCESLMDEAKKLLESGKGEAESALDMIASCVLKEPENAAARWNLAAALLQLNRVQEALSFIDEALTLDAQNKQYFIDAGKLFSSLGMPAEAVRCLERYLELSLRAPNWPHLLASISVQREDEWTFMYDADRNIVQTLELLLQQYIRDKDSLIKAGYLYKVVIGLKGPENDLDLVKSFAFFSFGLCDFANAMNHLHIHTEHQYVEKGYGSSDRAYDIVSTHALRLFTAGLDGHLTSIARNLLINGENVFNELLYNCELTEELKQTDYTHSILQKDVKRILAACVVGQNVVPVIVQNGAVVHAENIFGWTPLLQIVSINSSELLFQVLKAGADVQSRTPAGLTALHIAAIKGSTDLVLPLLQAGLKADDINVLNQTALDLACSHRWYAKEFAKSLNVVQLPSGCPSETLYIPPLKQGFKSGGWLMPSLKLPKELSSEVCNIDVIGYTASADEVLLNYLILQKPVLIRNATGPNAAKKLFQFWQRNKIVKEYSDLILNEAEGPLSEFAYNQTTTTLGNFLKKIKAINEHHSLTGNVSNIQPPPYILQSVPSDSPILEHFRTPAVLDPQLTEIVASKIYLHIGPAFSGVSPRFHQSSWNALVYGRRRWYLFPPKFAFYSKQHVWDWWRKNRTESSIAWECVQYPGDVLILPDMWGYATLNIRESIGLSSEFIHGSSEFSL